MNQEEREELRQRLSDEYDREHEREHKKELFMIKLFFIIFGIVFFGGIIMAVYAQAHNQHIQKEFCQDHGMLWRHINGFNHINECLVIDNIAKKVLEIHKIDKINGEIYFLN